MTSRESVSGSLLFSSSRKREFLFCLLLFLGAVSPFLFSLNYPFLQDWDDYTFIVKNPALDLTWKNFLFYLTNTFQDLHTPLPMWSFMLDKALWNLDPIPYRLENILIHAVNACLLYKILSFFGIRKSFAFAAALLWAVNPQKVESCIWITERKDVLCGLFAFASFLAFLYEAKGKRFPLVSSLLIIPSLLAKPASLPLPGVMCLALILWKGKDYSLKEYSKLLLPPFLVTFAVSLVSYFITRNGFPGGMESRLLVPLHNLFWYPLTAVIPFELSPMYPNIAEFAPLIPFFLGAAGGLVLLLYLATRLEIPFTKSFAMLLITGGSMVPVLGLLHYTAMDYCDRYNYLVSAVVWTALCFLLEKAAEKFPAGKKLFYLLLPVTFCLYAFQCVTYGKIWQDSGKLFLYAVETPTGRPANETAIENGASSAIRNNDPAILERMAARMEQDQALYRKNSTHLLHTALFFRAHSWMLRGEKEKALEYYRILAQLTRNGQLDLMRPDEFLKVLFRGGATHTLAMGAIPESRVFFQEYFRVQKNSNAEYFFMLSRQGILERNTPKRLYALERLLQLMPDHRGFRQEWESLRKGPGR